MYQLVARLRDGTTTDVVVRLSDGCHIPNDPRNRDRVEYDEWVAKGNKPLPAPPVPTAKSLTKRERLDQMFAERELTLADFKEITKT